MTSPKTKKHVIFLYLVKKLSCIYIYIWVNYGLFETEEDSLKVKLIMANLAATSMFFLTVFFMSLVSQIYGSKSDITNKHVALFIFGDSLLDAGNNNYINTTTLDQANFLPYGETYFKFPTGRFCDGRLISDFIGKI